MIVMASSRASQRAMVSVGGASRIAKPLRGPWGRRQPVGPLGREIARQIGQLQRFDLVLVVSDCSDQRRRPLPALFFPCVAVEPECPAKSRKARGVDPAPVQIWKWPRRIERLSSVEPRFRFGRRGGAVYLSFHGGRLNGRVRPHALGAQGVDYGHLRTAGMAFDENPAALVRKAQGRVLIVVRRAVAHPGPRPRLLPVERRGNLLRSHDLTGTPPLGLASTDP